MVVSAMEKNWVGKKTGRSGWKPRWHLSGREGFKWGSEKSVRQNSTPGRAACPERTAYLEGLRNDQKATQGEESRDL